MQIKYKESFRKNKDRAIGVNMSDSKTLHSLQVAKMSSEVKIITTQCLACSSPTKKISTDSTAIT